MAILASDQNIEDVIAEFNGKITASVPETGTYQVKFPVRSLGELNAVQEALKKKGVEAYPVYVYDLPEFGEPQ